MKTIQEIQVEARRLTTLGLQYQTELMLMASRHLAGARPRTVLRFEDPRSLSQWTPRFLGNDSLAPSTERSIDVALDRSELVFHLMEREAGFMDFGQHDETGYAICTSRSAFDVLRVGYELVEEDRLAAALEPYAERSEECVEPADDVTVSELEAVLEAGRLRYSDRLRTKAEIVEFLEGRLEASVFIGNVVNRQSARDVPRERVTVRRGISLTIDES